MPELPEVETTRRSLEPLVGQMVRTVVLRHDRLRWPIPMGLDKILAGRRLLAVERRAKYLLLRFDHGTLLLHLGMSGYLRLVGAEQPFGKHDHVDLIFSSGRAVRFNDARRFGACLWTSDDPYRHPLLLGLGPEPLAADLDGSYLAARARGRRVAVKAFLMDQRVVVGVGNIYANEALFRAGIHPAREAGRISAGRYALLAEAVGDVLREAIAVGGTTLKDFSSGEGKPGYFTLQLKVYGRAGKPCPECGRAIRTERLAQRSTFFCPRCQR